MNIENEMRRLEKAADTERSRLMVWSESGVSRVELWIGRSGGRSVTTHGPTIDDVIRQAWDILCPPIAPIPLDLIAF